MALNNNQGTKSPHSRVIVLTAIVASLLVAVAVGVFFILPYFGIYIGGGDSYQGYKRGHCPAGQYEIWSGGAPSGDINADYPCGSKMEVDARIDSTSKGEALKPVIMLYSDKDTNFTINLNFKLSNSFIYPKYNYENSGWVGKVLAGADGKLQVDGKSYDYLFWEGLTEKQYDLRNGNVVQRLNTTEFLENALSSYGLNAREIEDFITFWGPKMNKNEYNVVSFVNEEYSAAHPLSISPKPDYVQRVFMVFKGVDKNFQISKQVFDSAPTRHGFSVIEWGGEEL